MGDRPCERGKMYHMKWKVLTEESLRKELVRETLTSLAIDMVGLNVTGRGRNEMKGEIVINGE